ncbi:hypothetical protein RFN58_04770 [Streptomyces iakyrus]|nr:hypothetical protein [Streptomyces iakyrus]
MDSDAELFHPTLIAAAVRARLLRHPAAVPRPLMRSVATTGMAALP